LDADERADTQNKQRKKGGDRIGEAWPFSKHGANARSRGAPGTEEITAMKGRTDTRATEGAMSFIGKREFDEPTKTVVNRRLGGKAGERGTRY